MSSVVLGIDDLLDMIHFLRNLGRISGSTNSNHNRSVAFNFFLSLPNLVLSGFKIADELN